MDMINEAERKALTDAIVDHMLAMKQNVWDCLKILDETMIDIEQKSSEIAGCAVYYDDTFGFFENNDATYKSKLDYLLDSNFSVEKIPSPDELIKYLFTGVKFYNHMLKNEFYLVSDLPIMLTIDRKMNTIFIFCTILNLQYKKYLSEKIRHVRSKYEKNKKGELISCEILRVINLISAANGNKKYSIQGLAEEIHKQYKRIDKPSVRTIVTKIKMLFAGKFSGEPREKYLPANLIGEIAGVKVKNVSQQNLQVAFGGCRSPTP